MKRKSGINKEAQVLLKLIRLALRREPLRYFGEPVEPFPEDINWKEVIRLSYEQKVSALAVDGLHSVNYNPYEGLDETKKEKLKSILTPWIEDVKNLEKEYTYYVEVIKFLGQFFASNGLKMIILKGAGLAQYYPNPLHRGAGDIDFYLLDENGQPASKQGDELMQNHYSEMFHLMEHQNAYHTQYNFKGIIIENHFEIISSFVHSQEENYLEEILKSMICAGFEPIKGMEGAYRPSIEFNTIHVLRHIFTHYYFNTTTLRQIVDYALIIKSQSDFNNHQIIDNILTKSKLIDFSNNLDLILSTYFRLFSGKGNIHWNLIEESFEPKSQKRGISNYNQYFKNRKKIKSLTGEHWLFLTLKSVARHI